MAKATGFRIDLKSMDIRMNRGDTGSFFVAATRRSGTAWTADDRMLMTITNSQGEIVIQRLYRLDNQWGAGDGVILVEFHNADTDTMAPGLYNVELRFDVDPIWNGTPPESRCADALTADARMVEGPIVRTVIHSTLTIEDVRGNI